MNINYLDKIVDEMIENMDESSKKLILNTKLDGMSQFHHGAGTATRNKYNLWKQDSLEGKWFAEQLNVFHGDDRSGIIMEALWHKIHNLPYDPAPTIERYRQHWAEQGLNLDQTKLLNKV